MQKADGEKGRWSERTSGWRSLRGGENERSEKEKESRAEIDACKCRLERGSREISRGGEEGEKGEMKGDAVEWMSGNAERRRRRRRGSEEEEEEEESRGAEIYVWRGLQ